jgi:hypothetical protein
VADATGAQPDPDALVLPVDTHREGTTTITNCQPGQVWGPSSTISGGSPNEIQANNTATSTVTVELRDRCNALVTTSQAVTLISNRGGADIISPATVNTTSGQATFTVKSGTAGTSNYTATATSGAPDGNATVIYYGCASTVGQGNQGTSQDWLDYFVSNAAGRTWRLKELRLVRPNGPGTFTRASLQGTLLWSGSTNSTDYTISEAAFLPGTEGARTLNDGASNQLLRLQYSGLTVVGKTFTLHTTWDDLNGHTCTISASVTP